MNKVSIIIPIYFGKKYLSDLYRMLNESIQCCLKHFNVYFEIIIINDSPEESVIIDKKSSSSNIEVIYIKNDKNRGIHYSRCRGLKASTGNYIVFLDQDDSIAVEYFYSQLTLIKDNGVVVCNGIDNSFKRKLPIYTSAKALEMTGNIKSYALWNEIISPGQCIIRRDCIPSFWISNIVRTNGADDYFLWVLLLSDNIKFVFNYEKLYSHNRNYKSTSNNIALMRNSSLEVNKYLKTYNDKSKDIAIKNERFVREYFNNTFKILTPSLYKVVFRKILKKYWELKEHG